MNFEDRLETLWNNPKEIDIETSFLYFILITDNNGNKYEYIGKARNEKRLKEYKRNMKKISLGKERGKKQNYRAIHFVLFKALKENWNIEFYPLENCSKNEINKREKERINKCNCNLNGARTWRISANPKTIDELLY